MQQLSGLDASFLYFETPNAPGHVFSVYICDQSTAPGGKVTFTGILEHVRQRLHVSRAFRQRLVEVPFGLDHPYWIEDGEFDLEYHVRHIALPQPGDWRQLCIQIARLHSRPLDRSRPLWEMYVIEGLDNVAGLPAGQLRDHDEGAPCRGRRGHAPGDRQRVARPDARCRGAGRCPGLVAGAGAVGDRPACSGGDERRRPTDAARTDDGGRHPRRDGTDA